MNIVQRHFGHCRRCCRPSCFGRLLQSIHQTFLQMYRTHYTQNTRKINYYFPLSPDDVVSNVHVLCFGLASTTKPKKHLTKEKIRWNDFLFAYARGDVWSLLMFYCDWSFVCVVSISYAMWILAFSKFEIRKQTSACIVDVLCLVHTLDVTSFYYLFAAEVCIIWNRN